MTLKDFECQSSVLLGECINLLVPFFFSFIHSSNPNDTERILEICREITSCRTTINELETKIVSYLLKFLYEQLHQYKINQLKQLRANDQFIQKLFNYLSAHVNQPSDEHILTQVKYEYGQQQKIIQNSHNTSFLPNNKH
ncbi:unnamed protein product [Rotaria sp. Silwood2]|nr:unnamed protein product [Rotaria sp. Silwood2]CAF3074534.1 unnamed protein product [Rotaria sp. Silwood2]CAF3325003.1 unnamed protein product [Rotaria sp. Silwood2]CAF3406802.1 unnamed protein product [Rotaria sp. Silwood2]CAF4178966.1 unnamed protein product [Rotaria sp. Silwood2]